MLWSLLHSLGRGEEVTYDEVWHPEQSSED